MPRIKKELKDKIEIASKKAEIEVYQKIKKKKKTYTNTKTYDETALGTPISLPKSNWIDDPLGEQGKVFFDGYNYWLIKLGPSIDGIKKVFSIKYIPEQWEKRNKKGEKNGRNLSDT